MGKIRLNRLAAALLRVPRTYLRKGRPLPHRTRPNNDFRKAEVGELYHRAWWGR